jgi:hypothetical protein
MVYLFGVLAAFCGFIALRADEKSTRVFFACCCALNAVGVIMAVSEGDWRLHENPCNSNPNSAACAELNEPAYRP